VGHNNLLSIIIGYRPISAIRYRAYRGPPWQEYSAEADRPPGEPTFISLSRQPRIRVTARFRIREASKSDVDEMLMKDIQCEYALLKVPEIQRWLNTDKKIEERCTEFHRSLTDFNSKIRFTDREQRAR
jgi:hypothetical protein